jgi:hypothetical protein
MNVEIGAEAALYPEKEYINGIAVAVHLKQYCPSKEIKRQKLLTSKMNGETDGGENFDGLKSFKKCRVA